MVSLLRLIFGVRVKDANAPFRLLNASVVDQYISKLPDNFNLPNAMLTVYFSYFNDSMTFHEITFQPRKAGTNSINMKRICKIDIQAVMDFYQLRKEMVKEDIK